MTMKLHIIVGDVLKSELPFFDVCIANSCRTHRRIQDLAKVVPAVREMGPSYKRGPPWS